MSPKVVSRRHERTRIVNREATTYAALDGEIWGDMGRYELK